MNKGKVKNYNKVLRKAKICPVVSLVGVSVLVCGLASTIAIGYQLDNIIEQQEDLKTKIRSSDTYYDYVKEKESFYRDAYDKGFYSDEEYNKKIDGLYDDSVILSGGFEGCNEEDNETARELQDQYASKLYDVSASLVAVGVGLYGTVAGISAYPSPAEMAEAKKQKEEALEM